jgi:hypothetical protein
LAERFFEEIREMKGDEGTSGRIGKADVTA